MAVLTVITHKVNPGRRQDFLNRQAEVKKILERHGGKVRYWQSDLAGENTGRVSLATEFDDYAAWAKFREALEADSEYQAFLARGRADTNPPSTILSFSSASEVAL